MNMSLDTRRVEADFVVVAGRYPRANPAVLHQYLGWWSIRVGRHANATRYFLRAAAARDARYLLRLLRRDLLYLARHAAEDARLVLRHGRGAGSIEFESASSKPTGGTGATLDRRADRYVTTSGCRVMAPVSAR